MESGLSWFPKKALFGAQLNAALRGGFNRESPDIGPGLPLEAGKGDLLMILVLVKLRLALAGRLTALIIWTRKSRR
jgi:hypothetical protein